jgi:plasmid stability protein
MLSLMAQVIVRKLKDSVLVKLKRKAAEKGISTEEHLRRILQDSVAQKKAPKMTFKEYLIAPPHVDFDLMDFIPKRDKRHRKVDLG